MLEKNINIFHWNSNFNTGNYIIDKQNQEITRLSNKIASHVILNKAQPALSPLIQELISFVTTNFKLEEEIWSSKRTTSLELQDHKILHQQFINSLNELKEQIITLSQENWIEKLLGLLTHWLTSHIFESDRYMSLLTSALNENKDIDKATLLANEKMKTIRKTTTSELITTNTLRLMDEIKMRNAALAKLYLSEDRLREVVEYAQIGHWELPVNSNQAYWSPQMYRLFGLEVDSISGPETLCSIMKPDYHKTFLNSVSSAFDTGCEHHVEYPIIKPDDGETRWIECRGKVVYKENGMPEKLTGFVQDITAHKENENRIEQLAYYDALTNLPNRRLLLERLERVLNASNRDQHNTALLFLDIDNFKTLNDIYGHEYGDFLLNQTATRINRNIRNCDTVARIGGDEFVIILERLNKLPIQAAVETEEVAQKMLHILAQPYHINEIHYSSTSSIGIVIFNNENVSSSELMKQADIAMYQAKLAGKNTYCFFDPEMEKNIAERVSLEAQLSKAISEHQFELYYQPQVNHHNEITGAEALIRWEKPQIGIISPANFIPLAEDSGLIVSIGKWVLISACLQLKAWQADTATKHLSLSVNVSYKQFQQADFVYMIKKLLDKYSVEPSKLKIELTESVLAEDLALTLPRMKELGDMGVQLSLDDFGTGYSSLQYLKTLPIYQLKIDGSFVRDLTTDANDRSIVKTIISMAKGLGLNVIAEGVETKEQKQYLFDEGCLFFQGYLFSKPVPIIEFERLVK